jgi:hypothetical protein
MAGGYKPSILEAPFKHTTGNTHGLDPKKIDFIRQIAENISGARTKPVRFRKDLKDYGEFWPSNNNVFVHPDVISNKSPYYGGYSVPAHEYGHFVEYNSDPALIDLFKSAHKFDVKKRGSLLNQKYTRNNFIQTYPRKDYFSESFADTFAYSFLDRGDRNSILGGRAMSDLMRELIMKNIPIKSKANGFVPNFARRNRFQEKDDELLDLLDDLDLDNLGYIPGGQFLSDRSVRRGSNWESFTRFTADRKNRIIKIEDTESYKKGDAFKNYSALADFAKRKDFIIKSSALVKQRSRDNTKDKGIDLLYKLFPQLRYRDGITKNTSGKYHIGESEKKFSSLHDLKSQIGQLPDSDIRKISKFSQIQDNFAGGLIPNFAMPKSKRDMKAERKRKMIDLYISERGADFLKNDDSDGYYNKSNVQTIRHRNGSYETIKDDNYRNRSVLDNINYNVNPEFFDTNYIGSDKKEFLNNFIERGRNPERVRESVLHQGRRASKAGSNVKNFLEQKSQKAQDFLYAIETKLALADLGGLKKITTKDGSEVDLTGFFDDESLMDLGSRTDGYIKKTTERFKKRDKEPIVNPTLKERLRAFKEKKAGKPLPPEPYTPLGKYKKEKILGRGAYGAFYKLRGNVGVKRFLNPSKVISEKELRYEYPIAKTLGDHPKLLPGLHAPRVYGSLEKAGAKLRIGKEIVNGKTFEQTFYQNKLNEGEYSVIRSVVSKAMDKIGIRASDLHQGNLMVNEKGIELLNRYRKLLNPDSNEGSKLIRDGNLDTIASAFARRGGRISLIDPGLFMQKESGIVTNPDYGKLKDKLAAKRDLNYADGIIPNFAIDKSVYRHYYKQLKRQLRSSRAINDLSGYGFWDSMGKYNKSTTLYRGTDRGEVESILNKGSFASNWTDNYSGDRGTFVSSSINHARGYSEQANKNKGEGYMLAFRKNIAGENRERRISHRMGGTSTNMAISGDIFDSDIRTILKYDESKKGKLKALSLGELLSQSMGREMSSLLSMGYPSYIAKNSIKVGSHDRLKSDKNPRGLGVYNTAQGQMSLGQALGQHAGQSLSSGIIPNFADLKTSTEKVSSKNLGLLIISTKRLSNSFSYLGDYLSTSFLSSLRRTTGSIIDITDTTNKKFKGIIDPTNIPSNKNAALVDPTGQPYGKSETARRLGLPVPGPIAQKAISSNIVGLPASFNTGKSVNYRDLAKISFDSTMIERLRDTEARKKSDEYIEKNIQKTLTGSATYGNIQTVRKGGNFTPNLKQLETVTKLGVPFPTPILNGGLGSPTVELPPILRNKVEDTQTSPRETVKELLKRLGVPVPGPVTEKITKAGAKAKPPILSSPWQPPPPKAGPWVPYPSLSNDEAKREADLMKENNEAIEKDIKSRNKAQKEREKAEANREKNINQYEKDKASREKQFARDKRVRGRQGQIASIIEGRVSNLQFGGPEQNLKSLIERAEKSLGKEGASKIEKRFKDKEAKAFEAFSAQSGFFTSDKKLKSIAKKLNISTSSQEFIDKREKVRSNKQTAIQTGAFALPFVAGGIANTLGGQDTSTGRVTSGIGEALGTGLLLSQFGPWGVAAGAAVGSFQVLSTVVKELTPDLNELSKKSREVTAANEKEISSLQAFVQTSSQLKSLIDSNSSPSTVAQAKTALSESTRGLSGNAGARLLKAKTDEERASIIQDVTLTNQRKQSLTDSGLLAGSIINEKASGVSANISRILGGSRKFLDSSDSQTIASELVKTIDLSKISDEAVSKAKSGKASLKDLGLDNAEVGKVFDNINTFFNDGSKNQTGASEQILKFAQSLIVAQKSLDQLSSQQIDTAKIFASTKDSFLNILTSTFAQNQSVNKNIISGNEIGFSNAEAILAKSSESLSPEELLKGSTRIKQARIGQQTAIEKTSLGNEYTNKVLEDIMSQASGTSLEDQIKIQDVLNKSITGESPFDPLKLTDEIQKILDPDVSKSLQSQLLKTNIEMASKLQDIDNKSKEANEELKNQTEVQQKQLADTKLLNILGGFNSNFRDVLRSIKQPKGSLTTVARGEKANNFQFGEISNIGSAKPGSMDAVDRSQRNIEIATNRASYFADIELPKVTREKINERNYKDLYLAGKSNVENRALAFGQSEILPQFDILKNKIAGKDTGSIGRKAIDRQLESVKKSFDLGQIPVITAEFVKTMQSLMPQAGKDGAMQRALDVILDETGIVQEVFLSAEKSAKVLADKTIKGDKLPPEFDAQIDAIGSNTTVLLQNTLSLDALQTVLNDLPSKINDLRTKSDDQVKAFSLSSQMQALQTDTTFKANNLQKATDASLILGGAVKKAELDADSDTSREKIYSLGATSLFPSLSNKDNPLGLYGAGNEMGGARMREFLKFEGASKLPSSPSELNEALKVYIEKKFPESSLEDKEKIFQKYSKNSSYQGLLSGVSRDSGLFEGGIERNRDVLNADILNNTKKIEELKKELEKLNSNTNVQSNNTTPVTPTTTQVAPTVNISFNGVGSVDPNKVRDAVYSALANINRENNLPPPIQRPVSNTLVA